MDKKEQAIEVIAEAINKAADTRSTVKLQFDVHMTDGGIARVLKTAEERVL